MPVFSGQFRYQVDSKQRVQIPAPFRNQLIDRSEDQDEEGIFFHVTFGSEACLYIYPRSIFTKEVAKLQEECGSFFTPPEKTRLFRKFMSNAQPLRSDNQGRIIVPKEHLEYAKIESDVLIVGLGNRFEFWNPDLFRQSVGAADAVQ